MSLLDLGEDLTETLNSSSEEATKRCGSDIIKSFKYIKSTTASPVTTDLTMTTPWRRDNKVSNYRESVETAKEGTKKREGMGARLER